MAVIKKISELEQLEVLSDASNVIIEENGKAKRFSANNIGAVKTVNGNEPDENGNVAIDIPEGSGGSAIIDVFELPTENINEGVFYRLTGAHLVCNRDDGGQRCIFVETLPEVGQPVTTDNGDILCYYNLADGEVYGYISAEIGAEIEVSSGWYTFAMIVPMFEGIWMGVITDIDDDPCDGAIRLLLTKSFYIYQDGWCEVPFACEKEPKFVITWDGVIGDRLALDLSTMGADEGTYLVKVSDMVFAAEEIIGAKCTSVYNDEFVIEEGDMDGDSLSGALGICGGNVTIVHSADDFNAAVGAPDGYITNGTYFVYCADGYYVNRLFAPARITKIDEKFLPEMNYVDWSTFNIRLNSYVQTSTLDSRLTSYVTTSQVNNMISNAIGSAIGGSY